MKHNKKIQEISYNWLEIVLVGLFGCLGLLILIGILQGFGISVPYYIINTIGCMGWLLAFGIPALLVILGKLGVIEK